MNVNLQAPLCYHCHICVQNVRVCMCQRDVCAKCVSVYEPKTKFLCVFVSNVCVCVCVYARTKSVCVYVLNMCVWATYVCVYECQICVYVGQFPSKKLPPPKSNKSRISNSSVQIQIQSKSQSEFVPRDTEKSSFPIWRISGCCMFSGNIQICAFGQMCTRVCVPNVCVRAQCVCGYFQNVCECVRAKSVCARQISVCMRANVFVRVCVC